MGVLIRAARRFKPGSGDFGSPSGFRQTSHGERERASALRRRGVSGPGRRIQV